MPLTTVNFSYEDLADIEAHRDSFNLASMNEALRDILHSIAFLNGVEGSDSEGFVQDDGYIYVVDPHADLLDRFCGTDVVRVPSTPGTSAFGS